MTSSAPSAPPLTVKVPAMAVNAKTVIEPSFWNRPACGPVGV
jgi:hypothetical protein